MATGKRYYWIKLKDSFLGSDAVDFLMSQPDGANYVVLYQILCLKTINTGGKLERHIGEIIIPYDEAKIQRDARWFTIDTVRVALNLYKALGLIYVDQNGTLALADFDNLVGSETDYAEKNRRLRANQQAALTGHNVSTDVSTDVSENVSIDIEIRDKEKETREQSIEEEGKTVIGPEKLTGITLILNDGSEFAVAEDYIERMKPLFPNVDIRKELRKMSAWCINNPARRKTRRGVTRFINSWLSSSQAEAEEKAKTSGKKTNNIFLEILEGENGSE